MNKSQKQLVAQALLLGWRFEGQTANNHMKFRGPQGDIYVTAGTPSDHRAWKNALAHMKRVNRGHEG